MATASTSLQLYDGMLPAIQAVNVAVEHTLQRFGVVKMAVKSAMNTAQIEMAWGAMERANSSVSQMAVHLDQAKTEQEQLNNSAAGGVNNYRNMFQTAKNAFQAIKQGLEPALELSDQQARSSARLSFLADDGGSVKDLENRIMASAQRSRSAYFDTANTVADLGTKAGGAFSGNDEIIAFTEQLNKQFVMGGASIQEQRSATSQLTQAMASGTIQGAELNSIMESAPGIAQAIEQYMGISEDSLGSIATQGTVSAEVLKNALLSMSDETNAQFEAMPMTWERVWSGMGNQALFIFNPILQKINEIASSPQLAGLLNGLMGGLSIIGGVLAQVLDFAAQIGTALYENWSLLVPIIAGVAAALLVYNAVSGIGYLLILQSAAAKVWETVCGWAAAASTKAMAIAQQGLNASLAACPLTWIIIGIIAIIAVFYLVIAAINRFAGTSLSATGIILGAFATAGAAIWNILMGLFNAVIGIGVEIWNLIASFANFFANVFDDPIGAILNLFSGMFDFILGIVQGAAKLIDTVLGSDLAGSVAGFRNDFADKVKDIVKDQIEVVPKLNAADYQGDRIGYKAAMDKGYSAGQKADDFIGDKLSGLMNFQMPESLSADLENPMGANPYDMANNMETMGTGVNDTAMNTARMADTLDLSSEELRYLRELAEREAISQFTTAEVKLDFNASATLNNDMDVEGFISAFENRIEEALISSAEGVHV